MYMKLWKFLRVTRLVEKLEHELKTFGSVSSETGHLNFSSRSCLGALSNGIL